VNRRLLPTAARWPLRSSPGSCPARCSCAVSSDDDAALRFARGLARRRPCTASRRPASRAPVSRTPSRSRGRQHHRPGRRRCAGVHRSVGPRCLLPSLEPRHVELERAALSLPSDPRRQGVTPRSVAAETARSWCRPRRRDLDGQVHGSQVPRRQLERHRRRAAGAPAMRTGNLIGSTGTPRSRDPLRRHLRTTASCGRPPMQPVDQPGPGRTFPADRSPSSAAAARWRSTPHRTAAGSGSGHRRAVGSCTPRRSPSFPE
jgi:hypothetical protein